MKLEKRRGTDGWVQRLADSISMTTVHTYTHTIITQNHIMCIYVLPYTLSVKPHMVSKSTAGNCKTDFLSVPYLVFYNNNNTQKAAVAKVPLTMHPHEWAEPHTLQTQFTLAYTTWPSPLPCEIPDLPDLPTLPPTPATGPRSPAEDWH